MPQAAPAWVASMARDFLRLKDSAAAVIPAARFISCFCQLYLVLFKTIGRTSGAVPLSDAVTSVSFLFE